MHDIRWIRDDPAAFDAALARRGLAGHSGRLLALDEELRACQTELQRLQSRRNEASKEIGKAKAKGPDGAAEADRLIEEVANLKQRLATLEDDERGLQERLKAALSALPNAPADDVPDGADEADNRELRRSGEPRDGAGLEEHFDLGERLGDMDFAAAAKLSGARFVVLRRHIARLHRAIGQFMLDTQVEKNGFLEVDPPLLVREQTMFGTGQLPKFADDQFRTTDDYWLIPTAEVPLTNLVAGEILDEAALPLRFTALTPCFRAEAGAAGRDTRGMIRQHQFTKVEMVAVTRPEDSDAEQERMVACAEGILGQLGLAWRVVSLCTGDLGFGARRTFDVEVWLPGQGAYREISSVSTCGDFQARRMGARYRPAGEKKQTRLVHTLNGSGVAVGRAAVAILENHQEADGGVRVPAALRQYLGGAERLVPHG
jgi:seryl-tRNA synthetase